MLLQACYSLQVTENLNLVRQIVADKISLGKLILNHFDIKNNMR